MIISSNQMIVVPKIRVLIGNIPVIISYDSHKSTAYNINIAVWRHHITSILYDLNRWHLHNTG